jgi:chromosome segregation ATPase
MSLEKSMNDLEDHISSARYEFDNLREKIERELEDVNTEISDLRHEIADYIDQIDALNEQLEEWKHKCVILEAENLEVTSKHSRLLHFSYSS